MRAFLFKLIFCAVLAVAGTVALCCHYPEVPFSQAFKYIGGAAGLLFLLMLAFRYEGRGSKKSSKKSKKSSGKKRGASNLEQAFLDAEDEDFEVPTDAQIRRMIASGYKGEYGPIAEMTRGEAREWLETFGK